jgi:kinesin family protein 1
MEDLVELLPAVSEANAISDELKQTLDFEVMLVSPEARGELTGRVQAFVKVIDAETGIEWLWSREKFFNRKFVMQEMYSKFADGEDWHMPPVSLIGLTEAFFALVLEVLV